MEIAATCRPRDDDRRRVRRFVIGERRSGFDRRRRLGRPPLRGALDSALRRLRDHPRTLVEILALANLLSLLDLVLTRTLLHAGAATEANPVMRYVLAGGTAQATFVKIAVVAAVSLGIWALRRRRAALTTAVFFVGVYGAVVLYKLAGLTRLA